MRKREEEREKKAKAAALPAFTVSFFSFSLDSPLSLSPPLPTKQNHTPPHLVTLSMAAAAVAPPFPPPKLVHFLLIFTIITAMVGTRNISVAAQGGSWCVSRSDASAEALQTALDYACSAGADCIPIQSNGLCYLPNSIQAHASYAFNSYYQRRSRDPGSCDFSGTAITAQTDPSYGSCAYPSSASSAGAINTPTTTPSTNSNAPITSTPPTPIFGGGGITGMNPPMTDSSGASSGPMSASFLAFFSILLILSLAF